MSDELEGLGGDFEIEELILVVPGRPDLQLDVAPSLNRDDCEIELTVDAASSVTFSVHDPDRALLDSGILSYAIDIDLEGRVFRLAEPRRQGLDTVLVFEDRIAAKMRGKKGARRASRGKVTRAEFLRLLVREADPNARFFSPELHRRKPIAAPKKASTRTKNREPGIRSGAQLVIEDWQRNRRDATPDEVKMMERVCDIAHSHHASTKAFLALLEAVMVESHFTNPKGGDGTSAGILQLTDDHTVKLRRSGAIVEDHRRNVEHVVAQFLEGPAFTGGPDGAIALAKKHPGWSAGQIAQTIQGSRYPDRYDAVKDACDEILAEYRGGKSDTVDVVRHGHFLFERKKDESTFECGRRLADEVRWRWFTTSDTVYFADDRDLMAARVQLTITPETDWVSDISFDARARKAAQSATITCRIHDWLAPPGTPIVLNGYGPGDGRWLVTDIRRPIFSRDGTITIERPMKPLLEPAAATVTESVPKGKTLHVEKAYQKAREIARHKYAYAWGGGHANFNGPYDCSGAVSAVLHAAGLLDTPESTTGLQNWGSPGRGDEMTVWVRETGDPHQSHTFIVFELEKGKKEFFEAGGFQGGPTGFHKPRSTAGFAPRHWKETGTSGLTYKGQQIPKLQSVPPGAPIPAIPGGDFGAGNDSFGGGDF